METLPGVPRLRRLRAMGAAGVVVLALAGCVRLDSATELRADDTFDQTLVLAFAPDIADQLGDLGIVGDDSDASGLDGLDPESLYDDIADSEEFQALQDEYPGQVDLARYDDGELVGVELTLTDLPLDVYGDAVDSAAADLGVSASIGHEDGQFVVTIPGADGFDTSAMGLSSSNLGLLANAVDISLSFTFPGLVTEAPDGTAEGRTATLGLEELLSGDDIRIVASDADQIDWGPILTWGGVALAAIVIVGGATLLVMQDVRARRRSDLPPPDARHESRIGTLAPEASEQSGVTPDVNPDSGEVQEDPSQR